MPNPRHHRTLRVVLAVKAAVGVSLACGALGALVGEGPHDAPSSPWPATSAMAATRFG